MAVIAGVLLDGFQLLGIGILVGVGFAGILRVIDDCKFGAGAGPVTRGEFGGLTSTVGADSLSEGDAA